MIVIAVLFPGQGSQRPGMGQSLYDETIEGKRVFDTVSEATGLDMAQVCFKSSEEELRQTENAQIALYTCSLAAWYAFVHELPDIEVAFAGHSVGEYAAVVASGALSLAEGARLVRKRGEIMASSGSQRPGTMAAILGLERDVLEVICDQVKEQGICVVANDNSPGQIVISGETNAVHAASALATDRGAKRVIPLNVSGAFHSPLMEEPSKTMAVALASAHFETNKKPQPVFANVTAEVVTCSSDWPKILEQQLRAPVRWTEIIRNMSEFGATEYVECGVGEVLCGLVRRIIPGAVTRKVVDKATLEDTLAQIKAVAK